MTLRVNNLSGGGPANFSFEHVSTNTSPSNTNTPSFTNMNAGDPGVGRVLIAVVEVRDDDVNDSTFWSTATCTIGGVSATLRVGRGWSVPTHMVGVAIFTAIVPNGATATVNLDISADFSGTMDLWFCALFSAMGIDEIPVDTDDWSDTITLDTSSAKVVLVGAVDSASTVNSITGGGNIVEAIKSTRFVVAYDKSPLGGVTDDYDCADANAMVGAAFR